MLVHGGTPARRPGFGGDSAHTLGISPNERDLDALRRDLYRSGLADTTGCARQYDQGHRRKSIRPRAPLSLGTGG